MCTLEYHKKTQLALRARTQVHWRLLQQTRSLMTTHMSGDSQNQVLTYNLTEHLQGNIIILDTRTETDRLGLTLQVMLFLLYVNVRAGRAENIFTFISLIYNTITRMTPEDSLASLNPIEHKLLNALKKHTGTSGFQSESSQEYCTSV